MNLPATGVALSTNFRRLVCSVAVVVIIVTMVTAFNPDVSSRADAPEINERGHSFKFHHNVQSLSTSSSPVKRKTKRPKRISQPKKPEGAKQRSAVGWNLHALTTDGNDNVWAGGSVYLERGLLLKFDGVRLQPSTLPDTWSVRQIKFTSPDWGWLLADRQAVYSTNNGGKTWQNVSFDLGSNPPNLETLYFSDPLNGWIGGWSGLILHTNDAGITWHKQKSTTKFDIKQIQFVNRLRGWARAWKYPKGLLLTTTDGGVTWKTLANFCPYSFTFVDEFEGWCIEDRGMLHTVDGGQTWTLEGPDDPSLRSLFFLNKLEGWVIGDHGIFRTSDGGLKWTKINEDKLPFSSAGVLFTDSQHGWAAEEFGKANLFRTEDGGKTWQALSNGWQSKLAGELSQVVPPQK